MFINYPDKEKRISREEFQKILKKYRQLCNVVAQINILYKKYTLLHLPLKFGQCLEWDFGHSSRSEMNLGKELDAFPEKYYLYKSPHAGFSMMDAAEAGGNNMACIFMSQVYCLDCFAPVNLPKYTTEEQLQIHRKNGEVRHLNIDGPKFQGKLLK